jgi:tRNA modification GTPase
MISPDTIVALSSAPGAAARAIVRLSGSSAVAIAGGIADDLPENPGSSRKGRLKIGPFQIPGSLYFFRAPGSYTGEDLIEFHLPGNPLLCDRLIGRCVELGARLAEPGEFTARAYFNGKMDLTQAEGVAATITAMSERQLRAARQLLAGELARRITPIMDLLAETLALVEAGIDFVDEDITLISTDELAARISRAEMMLRELIDQSARFEPASNEPTVALIGRPNAGKSTLLNVLARFDRAIVSPIAGTTRDALSADAALPHGIVKIIDVAGLDESTASDEIQSQMQGRARRAAQSADILISVVEIGDNRPPVDVGRAADIRVRSKIDLGGEIRAGELAVSAIASRGLDELRKTLDKIAFGDHGGPATLTLNGRHMQAIDATRAALELARAESSSGHEWIALHLREAIDQIGQIIGAVSPDELLGKIFSKFCIGK